MSFSSGLAIRNIRRKPFRSVTLILLSAFLAFSIFAGSLVVMSLQNGLKSYEARLGADVVVVRRKRDSRADWNPSCSRASPATSTWTTKP